MRISFLSFFHEANGKRNVSILHLHYMLSICLYNSAKIPEKILYKTESFEGIIKKENNFTQNTLTLLKKNKVLKY